MFEEINAGYIANHVFEKNQSEFEFEKKNVAYRFAKDDIIPPSNEDKINKLRKRISELICTKFENSDNLEARCAIIKDNVMKFVGNRRNNISRNVLGKFCVGAQLSFEEAQELFLLQGFALDPVNNRFDAIVVSCLNQKDDIYEMISMCQEYNVVIDRTNA